MPTNNTKPRLAQRLMAFFVSRRLLSDARLLEFYPPFLAMRIKVLELSNDWRRVRIRLPLNSISRNPGGVMFGGYQAALADPIPALACARIFPGYSVWTRNLALAFERGGNTDLELRFDLTAEQEQAIAAQLQADGRATPTFEFGYYLADGTRCTTIQNTVAIRPQGYSKATTPPAPGVGVD